MGVGLGLRVSYRGCTVLAVLVVLVDVFAVDAGIEASFTRSAARTLNPDA
jgi:hypothetical protein